MDALGTHLLLELKGCNAELLDDLDYIRDAIVAAADKAGATIVGDTFHRFQPVGVTGILLIAESHIAIHTWPEYAFAAADIFTCGEGFSPYEAAELIAERLQCADPSVTEIQRGFVTRRTSAAV